MTIEVLENKAMPKDLIYLALIESEFNPNAKSPVSKVRPHDSASLYRLSSCETSYGDVAPAPPEPEQLRR